MTTQEILDGIKSGKYKIDRLTVYAEDNKYKDELFAEAIKSALLEKNRAQFGRRKIDKKKIKADNDVETIDFYFVLKAGGKNDDS